MNKKILATTFGILLFLGNISAQKPDFDKAFHTKLVGVWQASPSVGSGMDDNF